MFKNLRVKFDKDSTVGEIFLMLSKTFKNLNILFDIKDYDKFVSQKIGMNYEGSIYTLIQYITKKNGYSVDYSNGIKFFDTEVKTFDLKIPALSTSVKNLQGLSGNNIYDELLKNSEEVCLDKKTKVYIDKNDMQLIVKGSVDDIKRIAKEVKKFNDTYNKEIDFEVKVYTVIHTKGNDNAVDTTGLISYIIKKGTQSLFGKNYSASLTSNIVNSSQTDGTNTFKIMKNTNTNLAIIDYLSKYGTVVVSQAPKGSTLNKIPFSLSITDNIDYIKNIKETSQASTTTTNNGVTTQNPGTDTKQVKVGNLETGFKIEILPIVNENDGTISVLVNPEMKGLVSMKEYTYTSGQKKADGTYPKNTIQLLHTKKINMGNGQLVKLKNGEGSIISGYMYETKSTDYSGLGGKDNSYWNLLKSSKKSKMEKREIVIFITAKLRNSVL